MRLVLHEAGGLELMGVLDGDRTLRSQLLELLPDVVIIDDLQSAGATLDRLREAADAVPRARRLLLSARTEDEWVEAALDAGADAVIWKTLRPMALGTLLRETVRGNIVH